MRRIGVYALALAALLAGACGGKSDDKDGKAIDTNSNASSALSKIAGGTVGDVCGSKAAVAMGAAFASAANSNGSVDYNSEAAALTKAANAAPSEIRDDFQFIASKLKPFLQAFADAKGDYMALAQSDAFKNASTELGSEEYKAAAQRVDNWFGDHCK